MGGWGWVGRKVGVPLAKVLEQLLLGRVQLERAFDHELGVLRGGGEKFCAENEAESARCGRFVCKQRVSERRVSPLMVWVMA